MASNRKGARMDGKRCKRLADVSVQLIWDFYASEPWISRLRRSGDLHLRAERMNGHYWKDGWNLNLEL